MSQPKPSEVICVTGVRGSGKTSWTLSYTQAADRLLVYDPLAAFPVQWCSEESLLDLEHSKPEKFRIGVYYPDSADLLVALAFELRNNILVLEEAATLFTPGSRLTKDQRVFSDVVLLGRHRAVSVIAIAQRAANIPITIRSQASRFITFRQYERADLSVLSDIFGTRVDKLPSLPDCECLDWHKGDISQYRINPSLSANVSHVTPTTTPNDMNVTPTVIDNLEEREESESAG